MTYQEQQLANLDVSQLRASFNFYSRLFNNLNLNAILTRTHGVKLICEMADYKEYEEYLLYLNLLHMRGEIDLGNTK